MEELINKLEKIVELVDKLNEQINNIYEISQNATKRIDNTDYIIYRIIKELAKTHITVEEYGKIIEMVENRNK